MAAPAITPVVSLLAASAADVDTDLLIVPVFEGESVPDLDGLDAATGGAVGRAIASGEVQGKPYDLFLTPAGNGWRASRVALVGAGKADEYTPERVRRVATAAALGARQRRIERIAWVHRGAIAPADGVRAAAEGLVLASFSGDTYKSSERGAPPPQQLAIIASRGADAAALHAAVERGRIVAECCNLSRGLSNEPSNVLTPTTFAERAAAVARDAGLAAEILD